VTGWKHRPALRYYYEENIIQRFFTSERNEEYGHRYIGIMSNEKTLVGWVI